MAQFPCPQCGGKMFIERVHEGYEVPCPHCGDSFRVPRGAAGGTPTSSSTSIRPSAAATSSAAPALGGSELSGTPADAPPPNRAASASSLEVEPEGTDDLQAPARQSRVGSSAAPPPPPRLRSRSTSVPVPRRTGASGQDTTAFVLGIVGIVFCQLASPFAWYLGHQARASARRRRMEPDGLATAGWVMGIIGTVLFVLVIGFVLLALLAGTLGR